MATCDCGCAKEIVKLKAALLKLQRYVEDVDQRLCATVGPNKCRVHSIRGYIVGQQRSLVEVGESPGLGEPPVSEIEWNYHAHGHRLVSDDPSAQRMQLGLDR